MCPSLLRKGSCRMALRYIYHMFSSGSAKNALRVTVGVACFGVVTAILLYKAERSAEVDAYILTQWSTGCLWGAITVIVLNAPVLGKCAAASWERLAGTMIGGWVGFALYTVVSLHHKVWIPVISVLYAFLASTMGLHFDVQGVANLSIITMISVLWAPTHSMSALLVMGIRIGCISAGVALVTFLAILIFPQAASDQAIDSLHAAMQSTSYLSRMVWKETQQVCSQQQHRVLGRQHQVEQQRRGMLEDKGESRDQPISGEKSNSTKGALDSMNSGKATDHLGSIPASFLTGQRFEGREALESALRLELCVGGSEHALFKTLADGRAHLEQVSEHMISAKNEVYLGSSFGRRWYFPSIPRIRKTPGKTHWHMPEAAINLTMWHLSTCMRLLITMHFTFREGFKGEVLEAMDKLLPIRLMTNLAGAGILVLEDFCNLLPSPGSNRQGPCNPQKDSLEDFNRILQDLVGLSQCSFQQKVHLTSLGARAQGCHSIEELLELFPDKDWNARQPAGPAPIQWCKQCPNTHELFLFPSTPAGYLAQTRWFTFHFLVEDLADLYAKLRTSLGILIQLLPGAPPLSYAREEVSV